MNGVTVEEVMEVLGRISDPETDSPITEVGLVDDVSVDDGDVSVTFHMITPHTPPEIVLTLSERIRRMVSSMERATSVRVKVTSHYMAEEINEDLAD